MVLGGQPPGRVGRRRINFAEPAFGRLGSFRSKCCAFAPRGLVRLVVSSNSARGRVAKPRLVRTPNSLSLLVGRGFSTLGGAQLLAPGRVQRSEAAHALGYRGVRDEQRGKAFLGKRIDRVERLSRRTGFELH